MTQLTLEQQQVVDSDSEIYTGYIAFGGVRLQVDFEVSFGASSAEKDSAFVSALADHASLDYLAMGDSARMAGTIDSSTGAGEMSKFNTRRTS